MEVKEAVVQRRSIKHYEAHEVSDEELRKIMEHVMLSPTSFNIQNWRFVVIRSLGQKQKLRAAAFNQAQCEESSFSVVFCADLTASYNHPERYWKDAPDAVREMIVPMIGQFYEGNESLNHDEALRSTGIAAQTLMLVAKSHGLDTCAMVGFDPKKVAEVIQLPEKHLVSMIVTVGKRKEAAHARSGQIEYEAAVFTDHF